MDMEKKYGRWLKTAKDKWLALGKVKYCLLAVLAGVLILSFPAVEKPAQTEPVQKEAESLLYSEISNILSLVDGAGLVQVYLTVKDSGRIEYQTDTQHTKEADREETRAETVFASSSPVICRTASPNYLGALVVAQGGDRPEIRLKLVNAVCALTGLDSHCVTVLKMK